MWIPIGFIGASSYPSASETWLLQQLRLAPKGRVACPASSSPSSKFRSIKHHSSAKFAEAWEQAILETSLRCGHLQDSAFSTTKELLRAKGWRIWLKKEPWNPGGEWVTVSEFKWKYRAWRTAIHRRVDLDLAGSNSDASSSSD